MAALRFPHGHFDSRLPAPPAQPASSDAGDVVCQGGMSPQHLSEIESGKRDPRLSSIERMAEAMGMTVLIVPDAMAPDLRRYVANNGRIYTTHAGQAAAAPNHPESSKPDHAQEKT